jgi:hypothetical protein
VKVKNIVINPLDCKKLEEENKRYIPPYASRYSLEFSSSFSQVWDGPDIENW